MISGLKRLALRIFAEAGLSVCACVCVRARAWSVCLCVRVCVCVRQTKREGGGENRRRGSRGYRSDGGLWDVEELLALVKLHGEQ